MPYTVAEAAKAIGKSKAAVFRAIRKGTISATRDEASGVFLIDPSELHRAFPPVPAVSADTPPDTAGDVSRVVELQGRLADAHETIEDLRRRRPPRRGTGADRIAADRSAGEIGNGCRFGSSPALVAVAAALRAGSVSHLTVAQGSAKKAIPMQSIGLVASISFIVAIPFPVNSQSLAAPTGGLPYVICL